MAVTVRINGEDISHEARGNQGYPGVYVNKLWSIANSISRPNSATFYIIDRDNLYKPPLKAEVEMRDNTPARTLLFSGLIIKVTPSDYARGRLWKVTCAGWLWELGGFVTPSVTYLQQTDQYIIAAPESVGGQPPG